MVLTSRNMEMCSLEFRGAEGKPSTSTELKLHDIESEHLGIPETEYATELIMPAAEFKRIVTLMKDIADQVTIMINTGGVEFSCTGDCGKVCVSHRIGGDPDHPDSVTVWGYGGITQTFDLRFLEKFTKGGEFFDRVGISMSEEVPMQVSYKLRGTCCVEEHDNT